MSTKPFEELREGDTVRWRHEVTAEEVDAFARLSGDVNPLHLDDAFGRQRGFRGRVVHGALVNTFISRILGTELPGPGCLWLSQSTRFKQPVYVADPIEVMVRVVHKSASLRTLVLETTVENLRGEIILEGEAKVLVPPTVAAGADRAEDRSRGIARELRV